MLEILLGSIVGGFLLNLAPCVFPVLSLKILSLHKMGKGKPWIHSILYSLGILIVFLIFGLLISFSTILGSSGLFGSWTLLFPSYNLILGLLLVIMGAFQLGLGSGIGKLRSLIGGQKKTEIGHICWWDKLTGEIQTKLATFRGSLPYLYSFLFGCMTTLIGSACCGPLLAGAMGLAFKGGWPAIMTGFAGAGLGMSIPYLTMGFFPKMLKFIPKSGRWLNWIKIGTGLGLILSGGWFLWLWII